MSGVQPGEIGSGIRWVETGPSGGVPALLLHGFTGSVEAWRAGLGGLSATRRVIAVDLPGHGRSEGPADPERYRIERVTEDLAGLLAALDESRADWVGYSMGGRIALAAAVLRPERVRRLVLEGASPGIEEEAGRAARRAEDEALARELEARGIDWFVDRWMALPILASQRRLPERVREEERLRRLRNDPMALAAVLRGLGTGSQPSFWNELADIPCATLLLSGALDRKAGAVAERMGQAIPGARWIEVPGVGHAVHLESPERWIEAVAGFLNAPETPAPQG